MERNNSKGCLLGFVTVALIEAGSVLALIATVLKEQGFQPLYTAGVVLVFGSALMIAWSAWLGYKVDTAPQRNPAWPDQIHRLTVLSFSGSIASTVLLAFSMV